MFAQVVLPLVLYRSTDTLTLDSDKGAAGMEMVSSIGRPSATKPIGETSIPWWQSPDHLLKRLYEAVESLGRLRPTCHYAMRCTDQLGPEHLAGKSERGSWRS